MEMKMDHYKSYGRHKAGTWGKPHKELRTDANQAVRALQTHEARLAKAYEASIEGDLNDPTECMNTEEYLACMAKGG